MAFDIAVTRDLNGIRAALKRALPDADIAVEGLADGIMLTGSVASPAESQQAYDLAARLAGDGTRSSTASRCAAATRSCSRSRSPRFSATSSSSSASISAARCRSGQNVLNFTNNNPFPVVGQALVSSNGITAT